MLPFAIRFFGGYETPGGHGTLGIELQAKVSEYLDFVMTLIFAFGLCFQMPVLLSLLGTCRHRHGSAAAQHAPLCHCRYLRRGGGVDAAGHLQHAEPGHSRWSGSTRFRFCASC